MCIDELAVDAMGLEVVIKFMGGKFPAFIRTNKLDRVFGFLLYHAVPSTKLTKGLILVGKKVDPRETAEIINNEEEIGNTSQG